MRGMLLRLASGHRGLRFLMNLWPPFRGPGIRVREISPDFRRVTVDLRMGVLNRNYVGTHFGGSLFAMTDPFFMILMMRHLGSTHIVWDKAGTVRFLKPARGTVTARIELAESDVEEARARTASGEKYEPTFAVDVVDAEGRAVARVEKTLYIRRKDAA